MSERYAVLALALVACATPRPPLPPAPRPVLAPTTEPPDAASFALDPSADLHVEDVVLDTGLGVRRVAQDHALHPAVALSVVAPLYGERRILAEIAFAALAELVDERTTVGVAVEAIVDHESATLVASGLSATEVLTVFAQALAPGALSDTRLLRQIEARIADEVEGFGPRIGKKILYRARYGEAHPYGWDSNTAVERMRGIDGAAVRDYLAAHVRPERARLAIVATPKTFETLPADLAFGAWRSEHPAGAPAATPNLVAAPTAPGRTFHVVGAASERQSTVMVLHTGPPPDHADFNAFTVLCTALGRFEGEVNRRYRHDKAATYGVASQLETRGEVSECVFGGEVENLQVVSMFQSHRRQVEAMGEGAIEPELVRLAEAELWKRWARRLEHPDQLATWAAREEVFDVAAPVAPPMTALVEAAKRYLPRDHWDVVIGTGSGHVVRDLTRVGEAVIYRIESVTQQPTP